MCVWPRTLINCLDNSSEGIDTVGGSVLLEVEEDGAPLTWRSPTCGTHRWR